MIEVKNLVKKFGSETILDHLNFEVKKGEVLGFLGPNGAGKTTTMKIITTFWSPTSGQVLVDGIDVVANPLKARQKIGYLPETVPLYDDMRVFEYLYFIAQVRGLSRSAAKKRIKEVVEICGLRSVIRRPIEELSRGYRQRVGLAQAILHEPDILILDEPTTGLDPNQIVEIRELIKKIGKEKTVVFSTHILSEVSATCDRVIIIKQGKIVGEGSPSELTKKSQSAQESIYIKLKAPQAAVLEKLSRLENVEKVKVADKEADNVFGYTIIPQKGVDLREYISLAAMQERWPILEFTPTRTSLEDVFRELTK